MILLVTPGLNPLPLHSPFRLQNQALSSLNSPFCSMYSMTGEGIKYHTLIGVVLVAEKLKCMQVQVQVQVLNTLRSYKVVLRNCKLPRLNY
jgi:hypothetical protein